MFFTNTRFFIRTT